MANSAFMVQGGVLRRNGKPFPIRGVNWNPVPRGKTQAGIDFVRAAKKDIPLMAAAGINAVRTYQALSDAGVLDQLYAAGIFLFTTVYTYGPDHPSVVTAKVAAVQDHPAIAAYVLGNEWNLNRLYTDQLGSMAKLSVKEARDKLNEAAELVHAADRTRPVASIWSDSRDDLGDTVKAMRRVDLWGVNAYRGDSFQGLFDEYRAVLPDHVPLFIGEFGVDAYHERSPQQGLLKQADATALLAGELHDRTAASGGDVAGGFLFEWCDEWWKAGPGNEDSHASGGVGSFNEAWFGLVDIDRNCRPAYDKIKRLWGGGR